MKFRISNFEFIFFKFMGHKRNPFRILINQRLQIRLAAFVGGVVGGSLLLIWGSIEILLLILLSRFKENPALIDITKDIHFYVMYFFFWDGLVAIGVSVLLTLLLSRRIVGPIYRIQEELQFFLDHRELEGREVRVRKEDEFKDLSHLINKLIEEIRKEKIQ